METEASYLDRQRRLASAIRANKLILIAIVVALAYPIAFHYMGFKPVGQFKMNYPRLAGYRLRTVPDMPNTHGIDFSQVYLAAQNSSSNRTVYYPVDRESWRREWSSTYHPLIHWLYIPLSKLSFRNALVLHNLLGVSLILLCALVALRSARCLNAFPSVAGASLAVMFLTPTGLMHLERGQMDLFTAASYVCTFALFNTGGAAWAFAAGALSTLKVNAWLCVGLYWCPAAALWGFRDRVIWLLPATILLLTVVFLGQVLDWIPAFLYVAGNTSIRGASFSRILPHWLAFALPIASAFVVTAVCFRLLRRQRRLADVSYRRQLLRRISFPFAAALVLQATGATPVTHDYRQVALLGLMPALAVWCTHNESLTPGLRNAVSMAYGFLIIVAMRVPPFFRMSYRDMSSVLLVLSLCFLGIALYLALSCSADAAEAPGHGGVSFDPGAES